MTRVIANVSVSLDGYIARAGDRVSEPFAWCLAGDVDVTELSPGRPIRVAAGTAEHLRRTFAATGAIVCGRRVFNLANGWDGQPPAGVPAFVVIHRPAAIPPEWQDTITIVTDGLASALDQALAAAGTRWGSVTGASLIQQCLAAGLLDELQLDLVPVLLGDVIPLFARLPAEAVQLGDPAVVRGIAVTHLTYEVTHPQSGAGPDDQNGVSS